MTAKKIARKDVPVKAAVHKLSGVVLHPKKEEGPPTHYATMVWNADITAAAGLRNGMSPAEVHAAIAKVVGPDHK